MAMRNVDEKCADFAEYDYLVKTLVVGDSGVGKSCLLQRFSKGEFDEHYYSTIGVDFEIKTLNLGAGKVVKLQIWDTAGQERFRTITAAYYRGAHAVLLVCDVSNPDSFHNLPRWLKEIRTHAGDEVQVFLVANKVDTRSRLVEETELRNFADKCQLPYIETSAKRDLNVDKVFENVATDYMQRTAVAKKSLLNQGDKTTRQFLRPRGIDLAKINSFQCCSIL